MTLVTLTTDFGTTDPFAGIMKGVIASLAPEARIVDLTHGIPPQDVLAGALVLRHAVPYFPPGTVHLAVVDPGVGGTRRPLCVETAHGLLVGPDNGLLSLAAPPGEVQRIIHLTEERFFLSPRSATFHGRDVFAPVAAGLATGLPPSSFGSAAVDMERLPLPAPVRDGPSVRGEVIYVDRFGNLTSNVGEDILRTLERPVVSIAIGDVRLRGVAPSYSSVRPGEPVAVVNSWGLLEIAVRDGSARDRLGARVGETIVVEAP